MTCEIDKDFYCVVGVKRSNTDVIFKLVDYPEKEAGNDKL